MHSQSCLHWHHSSLVHFGSKFAGKFLAPQEGIWMMIINLSVTATEKRLLPSVRHTNLRCMPALCLFFCCRSTDGCSNGDGCRQSFSAHQVNAWRKEWIDECYQWIRQSEELVCVTQVVRLASRSMVLTLRGRYSRRDAASSKQG